MKILFLTEIFPNIKEPNKYGIFNLSRAKVLKNIGYEVNVITPIGLTIPESYLIPFPRLIKIIKHVFRKLAIPNSSYVEGIKAFYLKWFWLPKRFFWKYEIELLHMFIQKIIL